MGDLSVTMNDLNFAWYVAENTHKGQTYGNRPYIIHIENVQKRVSELSNLSRREAKEARVVAILHDTLEDGTLFSLKDLESCYNKRITDALSAITKNKDEEYFSYVERASRNKLASIVKRCDVEENLSNSISDGNKKNIEKYKRALDILSKKSKKLEDF